MRLVSPLNPSPLALSALRLVCCWALWIVYCVAPSRSIGRTQAEERVTLAESVVPIADEVIAARTLSAAEADQPLEFMIGLRMRNYDELLASVSRGEVLEPKELLSKYAPLEGDYQAIASWLQAQGFAIHEIEPPKLGVFAKGTVTQVQKTLQVPFAKVSFEGSDYISAIAAPQLPKAFAPSVVGVLGLQPQFGFRHATPPSVTPGVIAHNPNTSLLRSIHCSGSIF